MLHILRPPATKTDEEKGQLAKLDKYQRRYLKKFCCGLCDFSIDAAGCGSHWEACPEEVRINRRAKCLENYKPRPERRLKKGK